MIVTANGGSNKINDEKQMCTCTYDVIVNDEKQMMKYIINDEKQMCTCTYDVIVDKSTITQWYRQL